jgi:hypothetical protein
MYTCIILSRSKLFFDGVKLRVEYSYSTISIVQRFVVAACREAEVDARSKAFLEIVQLEDVNEMCNLDGNESQ